MTKQQTIELLEKQMPGFYSPQQVISLISKITEESSPALTAEKLEELVEAINSKIKDRLDSVDAGELVDLDSAEFSIGYRNCVELDSINTEVTVDFEDEIRNALTDFFKPEEEEEEEEQDENEPTHIKVLN